MIDQPKFFDGLKVRRFAASGPMKFVVAGCIGILALLLAILIVLVLTSNDPLDKLLVPGVAIIAFGGAWWLIRSQTRKMLLQLDVIAQETGLEAAATAGLLPGAANLPQVSGVLPGGKLNARSTKNVSGGGPFTRIELSALNDPETTAKALATDAAANGVGVLAMRIEKTGLTADVSGVLGQDHVARTIINLVQRLKA